MARIRSIKPEFWTSEQIVECSTSARLLFVGIWTFSDDGGVHPASVRRLKMEVFPADPFTDAQMQEWIDELIHSKLLVEFESQGIKYWHVTGWHHQKIDRPNPKYPQPPQAPDSTSVRRGLDECSASDHRAITPGDGDGDGDGCRDGDGKETEADSSNSSKVGKALSKITPETLSDTAALVKLWRFLANLKVYAITGTESDRHSFVGCAECALEGIAKKPGNPVALFVSLIQAPDWPRITEAQDERARRRLLEFDRGRRRKGKPSARELISQAADRLGSDEPVPEEAHE